MSYASVLKNIPEFMGQPAGVAALASLGIHGAIALILPLVPVSTPKADKQVNTLKPVGLTTLSPKEISRLPQTVNHNIAKPKPNAVKPAPGLSAQLPPMPGGSSASNISPLPPLPALSSASLKPLPPLPGATNVSVPKLPRRGKVAQNLNINRGFSPAPPLLLRNYPASVGNPNIGSPVVVGRNPGTPDFSNVPRSPLPAPPPLSDALPPEIPTGMAPQNSGGQAGEGAIAANPSSNNDLVTPVGDPSQSRGEWTLASEPVGRMGTRPNNSLNREIDAKLGNRSNQPSQAIPISQAQKKANHFTEARQTYPQLQSATPENLKMDREGLENNVDVALVVKADGTIDDFQVFTEDNGEISFESRNALRKFLIERLQKNPPVNNSKPIYLTFNVAPQGDEAPANATANRNTPSPTVNRNNEDNQETPSQPFSRFEVLPEDSKPVPVNTIKPQLEPDPSFSKPVRLRQPRGIQIPTQKPSNNQLIVPNSSQGEPAVKPSQPKTQNWRERLTKKKSSETRQESSGIEKLRQLAKTRKQLDD